MIRIHWKMTAGALALSLGGLAAVAGVPGRCGPTDHKAAPLPVAEAPLTVPSPAFAAAEPVAPVIPTLPEPVAPAPAVPLPVPSPAPVPEPVAPAPVVATPAEVPALPTPAPQPAPMTPPLQRPAAVAVAGGMVEVAPMPRPVTTAVQTLELTVPPMAAEPLTVPPAANEPLAVRPAPTPAAIPAPSAPTPAPMTPQRVEAQPTPPPPAPVEAPAPMTAPRSAPAVEPAPAAPAMASEKKLKVLLHMGDDRPRFEVRDGDEVYLKVVCDKVEVKTTPEAGANMAMMRASGRVMFITPGGEGTCDELSVIPGAGQVAVSGKVSFKYNWGRAETTVSGEKMTFRLGAPGVTVGSTPATVPAGFQQPVNR